MSKAGAIKATSAAGCCGGSGRSLLGLWLTLLVNLSFAEDGQQSILRVSGALELLADLAQQRRPALLTLHNLCFCSANKPHIIANGTGRMWEWLSTFFTRESSKVTNHNSTLIGGWYYLLFYKCVSCVVATYVWPFKWKEERCSRLPVFRFLFVFQTKPWRCCSAVWTVKRQRPAVWERLDSGRCFIITKGCTHTHTYSCTCIQTHNCPNTLSVLLFVSKGQNKTEVSHCPIKNPRGTRPL